VFNIRAHALLPEEIDDIILEDDAICLRNYIATTFQNGNSLLQNDSVVDYLDNRQTENVPCKLRQSLK